MIPRERQEFIKTVILQTKSVQVSKLATDLGVSEETIRRDLIDLEKEGIIKKVHGGAILSNRVQAKVDNYMLKNVFVENKQNMANIASTMINTGDSIFLDSSTTTLALAEIIKFMNITVVTNSIDVAHCLSERDSNVNLFFAGGRLLKARGCFIGNQTHEFLNNYSFDKIFFSCKSIDTEAGVTDSDDAEAEIKKIALKNSNKKILMADHSKFNRISFAKICLIDEISTFITDKPIDEKWILKFNEIDVDFLYP